MREELDSDDFDQVEDAKACAIGLSFDRFCACVDSTPHAGQRATWSRKNPQS